MRKITILTAALLSFCTLCSCSQLDELASSVKREQTEKQIENIDDAAADFERGTISGNIYKTNFGGIQFTAPDGWIYASDEELLEMMNVALEDNSDEMPLGDAELTQKLLEKTTIFDMQTTDPETGSNICIFYENIPAYGIDPNEMTEEEYLSQAESIRVDMTGIEYSPFSEPHTVNIGGYNFTAADSSVEYKDYGLSLMQAYYTRKIDDFMMGIVITYDSEESITNFESCFEKLD